MFKNILNTLFNEKKIESEISNQVDIYSPLEGNFIELNRVDDKTFSSGILGKGFAIEPIDNTVYAPMDGTITMLFPTLHAIGLTNLNGLEVLIHIGIDTVNLKGKHFKALVTEGKIVKKGDPIITFDLKKLITLGYKVTTPVIVTNSNDFEITHVETLKEIDNSNLILKTVKK